MLRMKLDRAWMFLFPHHNENHLVVIGNDLLVVGPELVAIAVVVALLPGLGLGLGLGPGLGLGLVAVDYSGGGQVMNIDGFCFYAFLIFRLVDLDVHNLSLIHI